MPIFLPRADDAKRRRDQIRDTVAELTDHKISYYLARARYAATDAYAGGATAGGNTISRPTEAAVVRDAGGRITQDAHGAEVATPDTWEQPADPVRDSIAELFALLAEANGTLRRVHKLAQYLDNDQSRAATRQSSLAGECGRCNRPVAGTPKDKLVSGYCGRCRKAWERAGYPDRLKFERDYQPDGAGPDQPGGDSTEWDPARHLGAHQHETARTPTGGS